MQLELFIPPIEEQARQSPYYRKANKRERQTIIDTLGENYVPVIEALLDDIFDLYPIKHLVRLSMCDNSDAYQVIGCSKGQPHEFYMRRILTGDIYLIHDFSTFPIL